MIKGKIDMRKLERSLKRLAKDMGETNAQAICRWGVQTAREMAVETQVWGKSARDSQKIDGKGVGPKLKQVGAIIGDAYNVLLVVDSLYKSRAKPGFYSKNKGEFRYFEPYRVLLNTDAVNRWIENNQTTRKSRTRKLPWIKKKVCDKKSFNKVIRERSKAAGMAKGGWLGVGMEIAKYQRGANKINIGKNFLSYAQKHSRFGKATKPREGWNPSSRLTNSVRHSGTSYVLASGATDKAIAFGLRKTVSWYRAALKAIDKKKP